MASLKGRLKRARQAAQAEGVVIELRDGGRRVFTDMDIHKEMFLARLDLYKGESRDSEVLEAVRVATPESRQRFEEKYRSIEMEARIVTHESKGGWVEVHKLLEEGTVETIFHEGHTEEARRLREEARSASPTF
jgi:hypothetical protein